MDSHSEALLQLLKAVPTTARKLFGVIVREAYHGPMRPKAPGVATPPEILEACGLDVGEFYSLLEVLRTGGLIEVAGEYPMEEIRVTMQASAAEQIASKCTDQNVPLETVLVGLDASGLV